jgi:hypothetical protein
MTLARMERLMLNSKGEKEIEAQTGCTFLSIDKALDIKRIAS